MSRSKIAAAVSVFVALLAVALTWEMGAIYLVSTWMQGSEAHIGGQRITLQGVEYLLPGTSEDDLFVSKILAGKGVVHISKSTLPWKALVDSKRSECALLKCQDLSVGELEIHGKPVATIRFVYRSAKGEHLVRAAYVFKNGGMVLQFDGTSESYLKLDGTIDRLRTQLALSA